MVLRWVIGGLRGVLGRACRTSTLRGSGLTLQILFDLLLDFVEPRQVAGSMQPPNRHASDDVLTLP
jgi:hypothetical protein